MAIGVAMLGLALLALFPAPTMAQTSGATINVFCLDFGKDFPTGQTIQAKGLALDKVRGGLAYALSKGYINSNPYQVQLAVWHLQDNQPYHDLKNQGTTIAEEIVNNAGNVPTGDPNSISNLTVTNVKETSPQSAYGTATIQGSVDTKGLPVGFLLPASGSNFQNLVAVVVAGAPTPTATPAPTATAAPTQAAAANQNTNCNTTQGQNANTGQNQTGNNSQSQNASTTGQNANCNNAQAQVSAPGAVPSAGEGGVADGVASSSEALTRTFLLLGSVALVVLLSAGISWGLRQRR